MQTTAEDMDEECQQQASWAELPLPVLKNIYRFLSREDQINMSLACHKWSDKDSQEKVSWSELPSPVLEEIYSFLQRADQVNMSLVCRNWSEGYGSPSVWKKFTFKLTKSQLSRNSCPLMKFVRKYSDLFQEVKITCESFSSCIQKRTWSNFFIQFSTILSSSSQLTSVKFNNFENFFMHSDDESNRNTFRAITEFLKSQHRLKRVEFQDCSFCIRKIIEFLEILMENTGESLNHLVSRDFFNVWNTMDEQHNPNIEGKLPRIFRLPELKTLETDFLPIFEYLFGCHSNDIQKIEDCRTHVFSKLLLIDPYIYSLYQKPIIRRISSLDWKILKKLCPDLQVIFRLSSSITDGEMEFLIFPYMPINHLQYVAESSINKIKRFFDHLLACKTDDYLVYLQLKWTFRTNDFASTLNPFLRSCTKLKCFELTIVDPTNGVYGLLNSWLENRPPSLENVYIDTEKRRHSYGYMMLKTAVDEFVPRLQLVGLKVHLGPSGLSI